MKLSIPPPRILLVLALVLLLANLLVWLQLSPSSASAGAGQPPAAVETGASPAFDQIFHDADLPMLLIEPGSGQIVDANPAAARFYGYAADQLRQMQIQQINTFSPEQVAAERALAESEGRNYFIFRHRLSNGQVRTVEVYSKPYRFADRTLLYSIISDITPGRHEHADLWHYQQQLEAMVDAQVGELERTRQWQFRLLAGGVLIQALVITLLVRNIRRRRELEQHRRSTNRALKENRSRLEEAQRIARVGSWQLDHASGRFECSPEMCQILELPPGADEQVYRAAMARVHPDDLERVNRQYQLALEQGTAYELDHRLLMDDGRIKHVHVRGEQRNGPEGLITLGTVQDITSEYIVQRALSALAGEYARLSGEDFYRAVCQHLLEALALDHVFVGRLDAAAREVDIIVGVTPGGPMPPLRYRLEGTPCSELTGSCSAVHPQGVRTAYPDDAMLAELGIEAYLASSLQDKQQRPIGLLVGLGCKPLHHPRLARELLNVFVDRVCAEMQRTEAEQRSEAIDAYRQIVLKFSNRFINLRLGEVDQAIREALEEIGTFIEADSCYLFSYDTACGEASMTHEWCGPGMTPARHQLQRLALADFPGWIERHRRGEPVVVDDSTQLDEPFVAEILKRRGVQSLVDLPLISDGECIGFVGVASSRRTHLFGQQTVELLQLFAGLLSNIRQRQQVETQLRLSASVFANADESIMISDADGRIISVNAAFTRTSGYRAEEALGQELTFLNVHHQDGSFRDSVWQQLERYGAWKGEGWNYHREGSRFAVLQKINAFHDEAGNLQGYVSLMSDITPLKQHQRQLERIAHFDPLTGLPNRALLADRLQQAMALAQRQQTSIALLFIDLDGFKEVNDSHSHAIGDRLLVSLAQRMKQVMRQEDTLARLGGDEFVAVLMNLEREEASIPVIRRLLEVVADPVRIDGHQLRVSASVGVTFYPQHDSLDADQLLRQADQAMYQAKQAGKNRYQLFDIERDRALRSRHDSLARVRTALEQGELVLYYQPKVNMRSGELIGCEALIRWQHPERGLLPPAAFLPVIENHALAVEVGNWVLQQALDQVLAWRAEGLEVPVSVNIDAIHLQQPDFVTQLAEALRQRPGIRAGDLQLEILETTALDDVDQVSTIIHECGELGVSFALDDFGTGYSSLTYLKRLPARLLKIDRSFVRDMLEDPDDLAILNGVVQLASAFRREVIAEGVETEQHCRALLALGCELGQGYAFAAPMPATTLPEWQRRWQLQWRCPAREDQAGALT